MARTIQRKRKASSPTPELPSKAKQRRHTGRGHFPFLQLPRELRDEVYRHIVESDGSTTLKKGDLVTKCGLVGVNSQICEEFLDAALFHAPVIKTTVRNHNFAHVVTFLNRLSEAQLQKFHSARPRSSAANKTTGHHNGKAGADEHVPFKLRPRNIRIALTYSNTRQSARPSLNRWLDRFDDDHRRGAEVDFEYVLDRSSYGSGGYKQRPGNRTRAGQRSTEEARKIREALNGGRRFW